MTPTNINPVIFWFAGLTAVVCISAYLDFYQVRQMSQMSSLEEVIQKLQLAGNLCPDTTTRI